MELLKQYKKYAIVAIILLGAVLIFTRLTLFDLQTDDAVYSFRSLGYFDYMHSNLQTTPIMWFNSIPAWSHLSFHDAPPLVFIIQHIFFLFGESVLLAKLPFALAGVALIYVVYLLGKEWYGENAGLLAAFTLAISSYHIWSSRIGYLEPFVSLWALLALYCFTRARKDQRWYWCAGVALGAALLSKYTAAYTIPVLVAVWLVSKYDRSTWRFIMLRMVLVTGVLLLPVIIYNILMYQTRGHFDLQLAKLFGQDLSDWPSIAKSAGSRDYVASAIEFWKQLFLGYSAPLFAVTIVAGIWLFIDSVRRRVYDYVPLLVAFIALWLGLTFVGAAPRYISILAPWMALCFAAGVLSMMNITLFKSTAMRSVGISVVVLVLIYELFFAINTNLLLQPIGESGKQYSPNRQRIMGFSELETYLDQTYNLPSTPHHTVATMDDLHLSPERLQGSEVFLYDPRLDWFSTLWYFNRWTIYRDVVFVSASDVATGLGDTDWFLFFKQAGVHQLHYIIGTDNAVYDPGVDDQTLSHSAYVLEQIFIQKNANKHSTINKNGQAVFNIYTVPLN